ncbi:MAG: hypothetical protein ABIK89_18770 [Planctomycetota bacterium]
MAFQYLCPEGHLLEADESEVGRQSQCPRCASVFLIPQPVPAAEADSPPDPPQQQPPPDAPSFQPPDAQPPPFPEVAVSPPPFEPPAAEPPAEPEVPDFPGIRTEPEAGRGKRAAELPAEVRVQTAADLPIVHVVCPSGHSLETPREMLDQEAMCPFCQIQFQLRLQDSVEYREEKAKEQDRRDLKAGQLWLRLAIAAAVVVVLGLILLIYALASH